MSELKTRGYIPINRTTGLPLVEGMISAEPIEKLVHEELVGRKEAEDAIETERQTALVLAGQNTKLGRALAESDRRADAWKDTAAQYGRDCEFWRKLVHDMGYAIGRPARTSDDGSVQHEPLALVVRDIVVAAYKPANRFVRAFRMLMRGF